MCMYVNVFIYKHMYIMIIKAKYIKFVIKKLLISTSSCVYNLNIEKIKIYFLYKWTNTSFIFKLNFNILMKKFSIIQKKNVLNIEEVFLHTNYALLNVRMTIINFVVYHMLKSNTSVISYIYIYIIIIKIVNLLMS